MNTNRPRPNRSTPGRHSVWGRVVDPAGGAVPHAEVFWVDAGHAGAETVSRFDVHKVAQADAAGRFWAPDLPPGPAMLLADYARLRIDGELVRTSSALPITLPLPAAPDGGNDEVSLCFPHLRTEFGSIHAVIKDVVDGRPASRLPVALFGPGDAPPQQAVTTTSGEVHFEWLHAGTYRFHVFGTPRQFEGEQTFKLARNARIDAKVGLHRRPPGPRGAIRVCVTGRLDLPLAGARVEVKLPSIHIAPRATDANGYVTFTDLPARPVSVVAYAPGHAPGGTILPEGDIAETIDTDVTLEPAARLRVFVVNAATGRPVRNANLRIRHRGLEFSDWGGILPPPDAPPANHRDFDVFTGPVEIHAASPGLPPASTTLTVSPDDADPVEVMLRLG